MEYVEEEATLTGTNGIEAIWVASDDRTVVDEVRSLAPAYFPNVSRGAIVYVDDGVTGGSNTTGVDTHTITQVRAAIQQSSTAPLIRNQNTWYWFVK